MLKMYVAEQFYATYTIVDVFSIIHIRQMIYTIEMLMMIDDELNLTNFNYYFLTV